MLVGLEQHPPGPPPPLMPHPHQRMKAEQPSVGSATPAGTPKGARWAMLLAWVLTWHALLLGILEVNVAVYMLLSTSVVATACLGTLQSYLHRVGANTKQAICVQELSKLNAEKAVWLWRSRVTCQPA